MRKKKKKKSLRRLTDRHKEYNMVTLIYFKVSKYQLFFFEKINKTDFVLLLK